MSFIADLHIHSRFSRATSRQLNPHTLAAWGMVKGLHVLGTGDFTHPGWRAELRDMLTRDEATGLYRLKEQADPALALPELSRVDSPPPLFLLQAEISSIYKRHGKVRKVHNLVYMPDMGSAEKLSRTLEGIGNLASDGRPILGLDSHDLLELVLETDPRGVLIPAHIWTPWFAIFGSKSGFDSMEECFDDLTPHIFALETGLSSDPAMNRLWSHLDRYTLISNSDAHSGANLGREANLFTGSPSYDGIFDALRRKVGGPCAYAGTVEFFPEEGKYHLDGHRACNVVLEPKESRELHNICPVCGKPLTIGVLHRVTELADRSAPPSALKKEEGADMGAERGIDTDFAAGADAGFVSLIPLPELLGELLGTGAQSRKVAARYTKLVEALGPEMHILHRAPEDELRRHWEALGEGIARMRRGEVRCQGGYDGEYGSVRVFTTQEADSFRAGRGRTALPGLLGLSGMSSLPSSAKTSPRLSPLPPVSLVSGGAVTDTKQTARTAQSLPSSAPVPTRTRRYTPEQQSALEAGPHSVLVMAGPGAGKTHTLMGRVAHLLEQGLAPEHMLVVTFTRRAAAELRQRLAALRPGGALPRCDTLHALAWAQLRQRTLATGAPEPVLLGEEAARKMFAQANTNLTTAQARHAWDAVQVARERMEVPTHADMDLPSALSAYHQHKAAQGFVDYTDLLEDWLAHLQVAPTLAAHVLVDEVQDLSPVQWRILAHLLPRSGHGFFGIGDPDQAIYSFRGAQQNMPDFVRRLWPNTAFHSLSLSHRSAPGILRCANALMQGRSHCGELHASRAKAEAEVRIFHAPGAEAEARWVAERVQALLGSSSHTLQDRLGGGTSLSASSPTQNLAPGDVAVLVRLKAQIPLLRKALEQAGIPCAVPEQEGCWHDAHVALLLKQALGHVAKDPEDIPAEPPCAASALTPLASPAWPLTPSLVWQGGLRVLRRHLEARQFADVLFWDSAAWKQLRKLWEAEPSWPALLAHVALLRDVELARTKAERVQIMTLHAAKGLEFEAVFLPGLEEGLLPLDRKTLWNGPPADASVDACSAQREEERRLLYVGVTRAARLLYMSYAARRMLAGHELRLPPSPLLEPLRAHAHSTALRVQSQKKEEQLKLF